MRGVSAGLGALRASGQRAGGAHPGRTRGAPGVHGECLVLLGTFAEPFRQPVQGLAAPRCKTAFLPI